MQRSAGLKRASGRFTHECWHHRHQEWGAGPAVHSHTRAMHLSTLQAKRQLPMPLLLPIM